MFSSGILILGVDSEVTISIPSELEAFASGAYDLSSYLKVSSKGFVCFYDILY